MKGQYRIMAKPLMDKFTLAYAIFPFGDSILGRWRICKTNIRVMRLDRIKSFKSFQFLTLGAEVEHCIPYFCVTDGILVFSLEKKNAYLRPLCPEKPFTFCKGHEGRVQLLSCYFSNSFHVFTARY